MKIGINSSVIKEISGGTVNSDEVDLIEFGVTGSMVLDRGIDYRWLDEVRSLDNHFSVHAPYTGDKPGEIGPDMGIRDERNFKLMRKVFDIAQFLDAEYVVVHGDKVHGDFRRSFLNTILNLKDLARMADDYSITLLIENLPDKNGYDRIGILPQEILSVVESVNEDNLRVVFDVGHGNLTASLYDFDIMVFFDWLAPYIHHIHIHDNMGIPAVIDPDFGDQHLPLGAGSINFNRIFEGIRRTRAENLVLELKDATRDEAQRSIEILKRFRDDLVLDIKTDPYLATVLNSL